jgi:hypothetical protein
MVTENPTIRLSAAKTYINHISIRHRRPVMIWGPPGIGKSEVVESIVLEAQAKGKKAKLFDMRLSMCEPTDIMGIPYFDSGTVVDADIMTALFQDIVSKIDRSDEKAIEKAQASFGLQVTQMYGEAVGGKMSWAPPVLLPSAADGEEYDLIILFLDEINGAAPAVQAAAYQLILNRKVGVYDLPDNVAVVAAGNRAGDGGLTYRMPTPLANRFVHFEVKEHFDDWLEWAIDHSIAPEVIGFLTVKKDCLMRFDPKDKSPSFPTPRSWSFVSDIISDTDGLPPSAISDMIIGTIGQGTGIAFEAHRRMTVNLPNPTLILKGKVSNLETKEISALYSLATSLAYELKTQQEEVGKGLDADTMMDYVNNTIVFLLAHFEAEMIVMTFRMMIKYGIKIDMKKCPGWKDFYARYGELIRKV